MAQKKVGIVVVTYNRLELLKEVIASIRQQTFTDSDIVVVNNGSTDGTADWLNGQNDVVTITQENLGGAGGFNTGMRYVAEHGYDYCWVMDDDVVCERNALEELIHAYHIKKDIGYVCSKVNGIDGCPMNTPVIDLKPGENGYANYLELSENNMIKVEMSTFVSILIGTNIIRKVGLPYKEYFIWGDDIEYTKRISNIYDCYVAYKSKVIHKRADQRKLSFDTETDDGRLDNYFYMIRNRFHRKSLYRSLIQVWGYYLILWINCFGYLVKLDRKRFRIMAKALCCIPFFHPHIVYLK
jgi:GT2 family glycosyltransferase